MKQKPASLSKITRPVLADILQRKRLFRELDSGLKRPVVWVSGPGGSGKTTLVTSYLDSRRLPCLWYQIDSGDADISTFFYYMGLAARKAAPRKRSTLPLLTPEYLPSLDTFTMRYFEKLCNKLTTPFVLVFDNYQDVSAESLIHQVINTGLSAIPEGINVIVISRNDPHPEFARLRANSRMSFLGWDEIKFTMDETKEVLRASGLKKLSADSLRELYEKTEGWIAGLVLFMERSREDSTVAQSLDKVTREGLFDYFATEVFKKADKGTRDFLLKTAFLPQVTPAMAEKLTGTTEAGKVLHEMNDKHYFTTRHSQVEGIYQYHPLFKEFLLAKAVSILTKEEVVSTQRGAALLLEESGQIEEAVELFLKAGALNEVSRVICSYAQAFFGQGRSEVVRGWIDRLPVARVEESGQLLYWRGMCIMPFNPSESRKTLERALGLFRGQREVSWMYLSWADAVDVAMHADEYAYLDSLIATYDAFIKDGMFPSPEIESRIIASMFNAISFRQPYHTDIHKWEKQAFGLLNDKSLDGSLRFPLSLYMIVYHLYIGNFSKARLILTMLEGESLKNVSDFTFIAYKQHDAMYDYFTGSHERTFQKIDVALERAHKTGIHIWTYQQKCIRALLALVEDDMETAKQTLQELSGGKFTARPFDRGCYHFARAWESVLEGRTNDAIQHAQLMKSEFIDTSGMTLCESSVNLVLAEIMHEDGDEEGAAEYLSIGRDLAHRMKSSFAMFTSYIAEANMMMDLNRDAEALISIREAMKIGRQQDLTSLLFWRSSVMSRLCAKALENGIEVEYVRRLILKRDLTPPLAKGEEGVYIENWPFAFEVRTLGKFEMVKDGEPVTFSGKVQQKPLEMLKALISFGGEDVSEERINDALWPEADGDQAHRSFETTLYRLRKLIGDERVIRLQDGSLTLDSRYCRVDVWAFERMFEELEKLRDVNRDEEDAKIARLREKAIEIYKGHFLPGDERQPWSTQLRERLRSKFLRLITMTGQYWEDKGRYEKALGYFEKGLDIDPHAEEFYQHMMKCYCQLGQQAKAVAAYKRCRTMLSEVFGINPSAKTEEIYRTLCLRHT